MMDNVDCENKKRPATMLKWTMVSGNGQLLNIYYLLLHADVAPCHARAATTAQTCAALSSSLDSGDMRRIPRVAHVSRDYRLHLFQAQWTLSRYNPPHFLGPVIAGEPNAYLPTRSPRRFFDPRVGDMRSPAPCANHRRIIAELYRH